MWQKDTVVDHRSTMMSNANDNIIMRTGRVLTTYKKPTSPPIGAAMTKIIAALRVSRPVAASLLSALSVALIASYA